jgi:N-hydroxyarylamine O-acetyltransferase
MANHYTSTHPDSPFTRTLTAQLPAPGRRVTLRGTTLSTLTPRGLAVQELAPEAILPALRDLFRLDPPRELAL